MAGFLEQAAGQEEKKGGSVHTEQEEREEEEEVEVEREEVEEESMFSWAPSGQEEVKMFQNRTWAFMSSTFDN